MKDKEFPDEFEEDSEVCFVCGAEAELTGWSEDKALSRFECSDCGAVFTIDDDNREQVLKGKKRNWEKHLSLHLMFPFEARIDEHQGDDLFKEDGPLRYDDIVVVVRVIGDDAQYGVLAEIKKGRKPYEFPLCDLAIDDDEAPNYKLLENYRTWFANWR